jgi:hypothetical protein
MFTALIMTLLFAAAPVAPSPTPPSEVDWYEHGYNKALRDARVGDQLVLVALVPEWSDYSRQVAEETFTDPRVAAAMGDLVCLKYEVDDAHLRQVSKIYNVENFPAIVFANSKGKIEDLIQGYIPPEPMLEQLERITAGVGTVGDHQSQVDENPDDLEKQFALMGMLQNVLDWRRAEKVERAIRNADPEAQTTAGARLVMGDIWQEVYAGMESDDTPLDVEPAVDFLESRREPRVRFQGWQDVGNKLAGHGDMKGARGAYMAAYENAADDLSGDWAADVARWFLSDEQPDLDADERVFTLELAEMSVNSVEAYCEAHADGKPAKGDGDGDGYELSEADQDSWLADRLGLLAKAQLHCAPDREAMKLAKATLQRCVELQPESEDYQAMLDELVAMR